MKKPLTLWTYPGLIPRGVSTPDEANEFEKGHLRRFYPDAASIREN